MTRERMGKGCDMEMVRNILHNYTNKQTDRQTDGQTDGRTDGQTDNVWIQPTQGEGITNEIISINKYCVPTSGKGKGEPFQSGGGVVGSCLNCLYVVHLELYQKTQAFSGL